MWYRYFRVLSGPNKTRRYYSSLVIRAARRVSGSLARRGAARLGGHGFLAPVDAYMYG